MIVFPNCKINIGLRVLRKRDDEYHDLETIFYPLHFHDALEVITDDTSQEGVALTVSGLDLNIPAHENICVKAYELIKQDFDLPPIKIHLHKVIPFGAGLGGGSSNGAHMLLLLNDKFNLQLTDQQLYDYALKLGSDCPFFILNKPAHATGRGEKLQQLNLDLSLFKTMVVFPPIHIKTAWAFSQIKVSEQNGSLQAISNKPVNDWRDFIVNDFEEPIFSAFPEIKKIKEELYNSGAVFASMSGSGSAVFGLFNKDQQPQVDLPPEYFIKII